MTLKRNAEELALLGQEIGAEVNRGAVRCWIRVAVGGPES